MKTPRADALVSQWDACAAAWTQAVRTGQIESRRLCTDAAVVQEVMRQQPRRVLDLGCGEGWLTRALHGHGLFVRGVDAVAGLIAAARAAGAGEFAQLSWAELSLPTPPAITSGFDLWVCNFSLFHEQDAPALVAAAARQLPAGGVLVVQTLHASATAAGAGADDAWQPGSWGACGTGFGDPIPWYYRSPATWRQLLAASRFGAVTVQEPVHPHTGAPLSMLITASRGT